MIKISDENLIGSGTRRVCYRHPSNPELCIKIPKPTRHGIKQQNREIIYYRYLADRAIPLKRITAYHGTVGTSLGTGYLYDLITDEDGQFSRQFSDFLSEENDRSDEYIEVIETLEHYFFDNRVLFYDLNPWNILCRSSIDGHLEPYVIDGIGDIVAIPVLNHFDRFLVGKIKRRWLRFIGSLSKKHAWMKHYRPTRYN